MTSEAYIICRKCGHTQNMPADMIGRTFSCKKCAASVEVQAGSLDVRDLLIEISADVRRLSRTVRMLFWLVLAGAALTALLSLVTLAARH